MTKKEFTCIVCPVGCHITATLDDDGKPIEIVGNSCPRGKNFVLSELTDPRRTLTSSVKIDSRSHTLLPVRTSAPIPKDRIKEGMEIINKITLKAPVKRGDIICHDFIIEGCDLLAAKTIDE